MLQQHGSRAWRLVRLGYRRAQKKLERLIGHGLYLMEKWSLIGRPDFGRSWERFCQRRNWRCLQISARSREKRQKGGVGRRQERRSKDPPRSIDRPICDYSLVD